MWRRTKLAVSMAEGSLVRDTKCAILLKWSTMLRMAVLLSDGADRWRSLRRCVTKDDVVWSVSVGNQ